MAQGDTSTVFAAALVAFYQRRPFFHVEAGLRTGNLRNPFPEEMNRAHRDALRDAALRAHGRRPRTTCSPKRVDAASIVVTGNTVIDALLAIRDRRIPHGVELSPDKRLIVVTAHRRENFGEPMRDMLRALKTIAARWKDVEIVYPAHPNPEVRRAIVDELGTRRARSASSSRSLRSVRHAARPIDADPHRFGRHPGGGACARQARAGACASETERPEADRRGRRAAGRHRHRRHRRRSVAPSVRRRPLSPDGAAGFTRTATGMRARASRRASSASSTRLRDRVPRLAARKGRGVSAAALARSRSSSETECADQERRHLRRVASPCDGQKLPLPHPLVMASAFKRVMYGQKSDDGDTSGNGGGGEPAVHNVGDGSPSTARMRNAPSARAS